MYPYLGDRPVASTVVLLFATTVNGLPTTLSGSPAISVYKNSLTESVAGVTLTVDYDARTGMNQVVIDTSADGAFYAAGSDFSVVITTGTVGGTSQVGWVVGAFAQRIPRAMLPTRQTTYDRRPWPHRIRAHEENNAPHRSSLDAPERASVWPRASARGSLSMTK